MALSVRITARALREIDEAVEWAEQSPYPDPASLLDDVYEKPKMDALGL